MSYIAKIKASPILRLIKYLWPEHSFSLRFRFILALASLVISKFAALAVPLYFKDSVNSLSDEVLVVVPFYFLFSYGFFRIVSVFFSEIRIAIFAPVENQAMRRVAVQVFSHLQDLSLSFHLNRRTGGLTRVVERGVTAIEQFLWFSINAFVPAFFELVFLTGAMWFLYDLRYAGMVLVIMFVYVIFTILFTEWRTRIQREMNIVDNQATSRSVDALLNYETVKYFNNESLEVSLFENLSRSYEKLAISSKKAYAMMNFGQGTIIALGLTSIMIMASFDVASHILTVGDFVLVNTYLFQAFLPLSFLGFAYKESKQAIVNMEDMFSLLDQTPEIKDKPGATDYVFKGGRIEFKDVSFSYNPHRMILKDISFTVEPGKTLAIVGESGAGKSTIGRLLFRFYEITKGQILLDGQDIQDMTQSSLRKAIGIVPQDTVLFNNTIFYNIVYGDPDASNEEVEEAAKSAQIHNFIQKLHEGYESLVGERGLKLSGGEKQRVAIARTLLKKPNIFIFDEATSALDSRTEKEIQRCLESISSEHTTLIIAHRLSTIVHADEIILLSEGQIVERGDHDSLLAKQGLYADMWKRQQHKEQLEELLSDDV
jgi:ATP-binding cassette subfamily B protein